MTVHASRLRHLPPIAERNRGGRAAFSQAHRSFWRRKLGGYGGGERESEAERFGDQCFIWLLATEGSFSSTAAAPAVGSSSDAFQKFNINTRNNDLIQAIEVLVISSQKGYGMMFPKGGWESDETIKEAASREAMEEAGVQGNIERRLGKWKYNSSAHSIVNKRVMFPLNVTEELVNWPEMGILHRRWVSVAEAMAGCKHSWMREALD